MAMYLGDEKITILTPPLLDRLQWKCDVMKSLRSEFKSSGDINISPLLRTLDTSNVEDMFELFYGVTTTSLDVSNFDTSNVTNMAYMFNGCSNLTELDVSNFDTSNVTNMAYMFSGCSGLTSLNISNFDTSNVKSMSYMFNGLKVQELDVSNLDTSNATNMSYMFKNCTNLATLDLSNFNTNKVTGMTSMFSGNRNLVDVDLSNFDTSNVSSAGEMFYDCQKLEAITNLNLIKKPSGSNQFAYCKALKTLMVYNVQQSLKIGQGTGSNYSDFGTLLSLESLVHTIQELWDLTGGSRQTLTMSTPSKTLIADVYVKLIEPTQEQIDADPYISNKKPCVVCESTDEGAMTLTEYAVSKNWAIA